MTPNQPSQAVEAAVERVLSLVRALDVSAARDGANDCYPSIATEEAYCAVETTLRAELARPLEVAAVGDTQLQALWDEACKDSPTAPGWCRHLRFGRAVLAAASQQGDAKDARPDSFHSDSGDRDRVQGPGPTDAARDVLAERARQISVEGWTPEHDDEHDDGSMAKAAACYALGESGASGSREYVSFWPWGQQWAKFSRDKRRNLVKAGALILAEIERLDRAAILASKATAAVGGNHGQ